MSEEKKKNRAKPKPEKSDATEKPKVAFPVKAFVNKWGFIHLGKDVLSAFELEKGKNTDITIDMNEGSLIIRKSG